MDVATLDAVGMAFSVMTDISRRWPRYTTRMPTVYSTTKDMIFSTARNALLELEAVISDES
jgi:hypothetical protein